MRALIAMLGLALASGAAAQGALGSRAGGSMDDIGQALAAGQCERAAGALERAMLRGDPEAFLMAGWLSERGTCLERSADKAWTYYEKAHAAGATKAALRLAGLAATVEGGQDVAATLWWGRLVKPGDGGSGGGRCDPMPGQPQVSEAAFVEALKAWPQDRLESCRARVGFLGLVNSELRYPTRAGFFELRGHVRVEYSLHEGRVSVEAGSRGADEIFVQRVRQVVGDAIRRIPRPTQPVTGGVDYIFNIE